MSGLIEPRIPTRRHKLPDTVQIVAMLGDVNSPIVNPLTVIADRRNARSTLTKALDAVLETAIKVLGSRAMFTVALVLPLISLIPSLVWSQKLILILSSTWIQWWALHALQRSQTKGDRLREAKANADHEALEHIASQIDLLVARST